MVVRLRQSLTDSDEVRLPFVDEYKSAGKYEVEWNAGNYSSGIYFYKLKASNPSTSSGQGFIETKKMISLE